MRAKKSTIQFLILSSSAVLAGAILYAILYANVSGKVEMVALLERDLTRELTQDLQIKETRDILTEVEEERNQIDSFFILSRGVVSYIDALETIAETTGVSLEIHIVELEESGELLEKLNLSGRVEGGFSSVNQFLDALEAYPVYRTIETVVMERTNNRETETWEAEFDLSALKEREEK